MILTIDLTIDLTIYLLLTIIDHGNPHDCTTPTASEASWNPTNSASAASPAARCAARTARGPWTSGQHGQTSGVWPWPFLPLTGTEGWKKQGPRGDAKPSGNFQLRGEAGGCWLMWVKSVGIYRILEGYMVPALFWIVPFPSLMSDVDKM